MSASEKTNAGSPTPSITPSYNGMCWTGQEVILRLTTVPAGYTGGNAFHASKMTRNQAKHLTSSKAYHMSNPLPVETVALQPSQYDFHLRLFLGKFHQAQIKTDPWGNCNINSIFTTRVSNWNPSLMAKEIGPYAMLSLLLFPSSTNQNRTHEAIVI